LSILFGLDCTVVHPNMHGGLLDRVIRQEAASVATHWHHQRGNGGEHLATCPWVQVVRADRARIRRLHLVWHPSNLVTIDQRFQLSRIPPLIVGYLPFLGQSKPINSSRASPFSFVASSQAFPFVHIWLRPGAGSHTSIPWWLLHRTVCVGGSHIAACKSRSE